MTASNSMIVGLGQKTDPNRIALQTARKWDIPNARRQPRPPQAMMAAYRHHRNQGHLLLELRSLRSDYDCVGLVFGCRRTWIDIDHIRQILDDDGYRMIELGHGERGDVVLYEDTSGPAHVGILWNRHALSNQWVVLSQWGSDGEYFHHINDTPIEDWRQRITIWTERQTTV